MVYRLRNDYTQEVSIKHSTLARNSNNGSQDETSVAFLFSLLLYLSMLRPFAALRPHPHSE
jgi:hypothetical protein